MTVHPLLYDHAMAWLMQHPDVLFNLHQEGQHFIALHPEHGLVITASNFEDFEAKLNDRRPSILRQLYRTCTALFVILPKPKIDA